MPFPRLGRLIGNAERGVVVRGTGSSIMLLAGRTASRAATTSEGRMHRHHNGLKTALLFGVLGGVVLLASYLLFGRNPAALTIGLVIALAVNLGSYWFSASVAIRAMRAREVTEAEQPAMYRIVRELSARVGET
jgi:hypothetical protein